MVMPALLEARSVTKTFGGGLLKGRAGTTAVSDLSLGIDAEPPSITAIVGESGSGKTTLARLLLGLIAPTTGEIVYRGTDLRRLGRAERRQFLREVQVIFQDPFEVFNPFYKVDHVLETPITKFRLANSRTAARGLIEDVLRAVGLQPDETLGRYPHQLSGGQRQRIMVARAVLVRPRLIIADEPVSMVDASLRATILASLRELKERFGISLIYITHDLTTAYQISDTIVVLYRGMAVEAGDVERVVKQPLHPYSQLLVGSIPLPDPARAWQGETAVAEAAASPIVDSGCPFASRCPHVMPRCQQARPPLFQPEPRRVVACYLHDHAPRLERTDLAAVLGTPALATPESV